MTAEMKAVGLFILIVAFIFIITSLPTMIAATDTTPGHALENESTTVKNVYKTTDLFIAFLPYLLFVIGGSLVWKG